MDKASTKLSTFAQVRELPKKPAVAFSAALLQRMLPNYQLFTELCEFGDSATAEKVLSLIWEWLKVPKTKLNYAVQMENIEEITPDIANFDNFGVYPALDFCMALTATLQLMCDEEPQGAVTVSKLSQGGVEAYLLAIAEVEPSNQEIKADPLMQFEIDTQIELLALCHQHPMNIDAIKALVLDQQMSNIGLS